MTFDEWMNEVEVYSTRKERLVEGLHTYRDDVDFVIKWLEAAYKVGYESAPYPADPPFPTYLKPQTSKCSRCGINLNTTMGYVCNNQQCPTFTRVSCVTTMSNTAVQLNEDN